MMRTSNPALNAKTFERFGPIAAGEGMTIEGTVNRTGFLLLVLIATATYTWMQTFAGVPTGGYLWTRLLRGFVVALITIFKPAWAPLTAPVVAAVGRIALAAPPPLLEATDLRHVLQA